MKVEGVVLAAGLSSRAGTNKLFLELGGKSILARCLETMGQVCSRIIVVGGHQFYRLRTQYQDSCHVHLLFNEDYASGMFSSVLKGIKEVQEERFFLCPGDYPLIKKQTYLDLLSNPASIVLPSYKGRRGHPVLLAGSLVPAITQGNHTTLRDFINANNPTNMEVVDPGIHIDIDTIEDYEKMCRKPLP